MPTFSNQATLSYNNSVVSSNVVHGELVATVSVNKIAVNGAYAPGDVVSYAISIVNSGTSDLSSLTLTDDLGGYEFHGRTLVPLSFVKGSVKLFVNGEQQCDPDVDCDCDELVISEISVPAGGSAFVLYAATVNEYAPMGSDCHIDNTVILSGCGMCGDQTACARIYPACSAKLGISKAISPATIVGCDAPVTFAFTIQNSGLASAVAFDDVCIRDFFDPPISIESVAFNGMPWTAPAHYSYSKETGCFATVPGQITVPAANYEQNCSTGEWISTPGMSTLVITGTF